MEDKDEHRIKAGRDRRLLSSIFTGRRSRQRPPASCQLPVQERDRNETDQGKAGRERERDDVASRVAEEEELAFGGQLWSRLVSSCLSALRCVALCSLTSDYCAGKANKKGKKSERAQGV